MFSPSYIHSDPDGSASDFFPDVPGCYFAGDTLVGGQWLLVDINMDKFDGRAERINITLPHRLLNRIDSLVQRHPVYSSRSAFLATAARNELLKAI